LKLIVGLGNPGRKYTQTRHNAGFMVLDHIAGQSDVVRKWSACQSKLIHIRYLQTEFIIAKPQTYMNLSGNAVSEIMYHEQIALSDLLVIYDDFHLPFGTLRLRSSGSDGGHNGLISIIDMLGTKNFSRLRFGIGEPYLDRVSTYVLQKFNKNEIKDMPLLIEKAAEAALHWLTNDIAITMNKYNRNFLTLSEDQS
jgi:PTH1 family peptidyl-tRNA hydrolase